VPLSFENYRSITSNALYELTHRIVLQVILSKKRSIFFLFNKLNRLKETVINTHPSRQHSFSRNNEGELNVMTKKEEKNYVLDRETFLSSVVVTIGEVSRLTGATKRKIRSWTKKGYVDSIEEHRFEYGFREIQKIALIQQLSEWSMSVKKATKRAEKIIQRLQNEDSEKFTISDGEEEIHVLPMSSLLNLKESEHTELTEESIEEATRKVTKKLLHDPDYKGELEETIRSILDNKLQELGEKEKINS